MLAIRQLSPPIFQGEFDHVTASNHLSRHRFDRCTPRLRRNCRFLRGSGENPLRRLPHYRAALVRGRWVQKEGLLGVTGARFPVRHWAERYGIRDKAGQTFRPAVPERRHE